MSQITFRVRLTPKGQHIAEAIENGRVIAISKRARASGDEAIADVKQVLANKPAEQGRVIVYVVSR